jgi:hypothetical protein
MRLAAVTAAVVHELDNCHVTVRIAADPGMPVIQDFRAVCRHQRIIVCRGLGILTGLQDIHRLEDDFGVLQQVGPHFGAQILALGR